MRRFLSTALAATLTLVGVSLFAQVKIAVVDTMKVANECKEGKRIQASLKAFHDSKQGEITTKENVLKTLEEQVKDPKVSDQRKEELQTQFNQKLYEYQAFAKAAQDEMEAKGQKMQGEFQDKVQKVIANYAQAKGFQMVVEKGICLYNADTLEVTADVIAAMNQAYPGA
jgi:Skp family chaperone for outer membrane proteins